jgi:phospholipid-binding lipoprotein MlaA
LNLPSLSLLTTSPPLLSAALSIASPLPPSVAAAALPVAPMEWSMTPQDAEVASGPPEPEAQTPPPEGEETEIIVEGEYGPPAGDPVEKINAESYRITQAVDEALIEPLAYAYRDGLPEPIRDGLGNVVRNLGEPSNALNFLLQGKVGKAFETLGRLAINSTIGVGGLFDVAGKKADLPYRRNGFANTMGFYGVGPGPYLYLPVTGATSARDLLGSTLDQLLLPIAVGKPFNQTEFAASYFVVNGLDQRLAFDEEIAAIRATEDPYGVRRDTYLAQRRKEIAALRGEVVVEEEAEVPASTGDLPPQSDLTLPERVQLTAGAVPQGR